MQRRRTTRCPVAIPVELRQQGSQRVRLSTVNLSMEGARLSAALPEGRTGTIYRLTLRPPNQRPIALSARWLGSERGTSRVSFAELTTKTRARLIELLF